MDDDPIVTLIVAPRERFSYAQSSLESIYEHMELVSPLLCQSRPVHAFVHSAGGECRIIESREGPEIKRHIQDAMQSQGRPLAGGKRL